jgi:protein gp37
MRTSPSNWQKPLSWEKKAKVEGRPWRVFCASLADVFDNEVPQAWRDDLWALVRSTPSLSWQILTKRIGNAEDMLPADVLPNLWLGATVVNQQEADRDLPKLKATPAAVRFVSYEPALDKVHFGDHLTVRKIHQIIVGGESTQGAAARPFNIHWARNTLRQCQVHGVAFFMKQLGANPVFHEPPHFEPQPIYLKDRAGSEPTEWPEDLRVQEFPA